jgi:hypothetical protein
VSGSQNQPNNPADDLPAKFKGKSAKEIVDMYANLESEAGRLRNELGDTRNEARTWRSLAEDLGRPMRSEPAPVTPKPVEVTADQLIANPRDAIVSVVKEVLGTELAPIVRQTKDTAQETKATKFVQDFPNYVQVGNSDEFKQFVGKSKRRIGLADRAVKNGDIDAMRELMETWEERVADLAALNPSAKKQDEHKADEQSTAPTGVEGARQVATEKSGNSGSVPTGKFFYRDEVIKLLNTNPDKYYSAAYQSELMDAIANGRYRI